MQDMSLTFLFIIEYKKKWESIPVGFCAMEFYISSKYHYFLFKCTWMFSLSALPYRFGGSRWECSCHECTAERLGVK